MAQILKQSTAIDVRLGPFVDVGDGFTPETGVTIAASDEAEILKVNGAATVAMTGTLAAVTGCDGWYDYTVATGDVDTVGDMTIVMQDDSVYLPVFARFQVVETEVYDDLFADAAVGYLKPVTGGNDLDVTATGAAGIDWANVENPTTALDLSGTDIQLVDTCTANTDVRGTDNAALASVVGALADAAAVDDPTSADTVMQYLKQLVNVLVGTDGIGTWDAAAAPANAVNISEALRAVYDDTNSLDATKIPDTISLANINAEVDTALDTTIAELSQGVPTATPTVRTALMLLYMALRNKLDVATSATDTLEIHNDAGTRITQKLLTDDGSDYSEAKMTSGA